MFNIMYIDLLTTQFMTNDEILIKELGGPAKVAELLGYHKIGGTQRVFNWMRRGIPPKVKLDYPEIFIKKNSS